MHALTYKRLQGEMCVGIWFRAPMLYLVFFGLCLVFGMSQSPHAHPNSTRYVDTGTKGSLKSSTPP